MTDPKPKWERGFQWATFAIAVIGAITGVYGCYALRDYRRISPGDSRAPALRDFRLRTLGLIKRAEVRLSLLLRPGGLREVPVRRMPGMTPRFEWQTALVSPRRRVIAIAIRRKLGAASQADRLRLDLWREPNGLHHEAERVVLGDTHTRFPLPRLPRGQYLYAFSLGDSVVRAGRFRSPDECLPGEGHVELFPGDFVPPPPSFSGELPPFRPGIARRRPCRDRLRGEFPIPLGPSSTRAPGD